MRAILLTKHKQRQHRLNSSTAGFTVVEVLVVVIMVGVLAAMGGAGYLAWLNRLRVNAARDVVLNAVQNAQITARQRNASWQASFRENNGRVQWAVHSADATSSVFWQTIDQQGVKIDTANTNITNAGNPSGAWKVQFDYKGNLKDPQQTNKLITLVTSTGGNKRCVIVKTILGAVTFENDNNCKPQ